MKRFVVVGLGSFGSSAALALQEQGHEVCGIDVDAAKVESLATHVSRGLIGNGTDREVLEEAGASRADGCIVSTGRDVTASVLTAVSLRDCGVRQIHVKVLSDLHARILHKIGVAETVFPERESAQLLAKRLTSQAILKYVDLGPDLAAQEMAVPRSWVGKSLRELELPRSYGVSVIAIRDYLVDTLQTIPDPDAPLKESDTVLLTGRGKDLRRVAEVK